MGAAGRAVTARSAPQAPRGELPGPRKRRYPSQRTDSHVTRAISPHRASFNCAPIPASVTNARPDGGAIRGDRGRRWTHCSLPFRAIAARGATGHQVQGPDDRLGRHRDPERGGQGRARPRCDAAPRQEGQSQQEAPRLQRRASGVGGTGINASRQPGATPAPWPTTTASPGWERAHGTP
jgi:hypothetical protein